jgi:hypothetical protein
MADTAVEQTPVVKDPMDESNWSETPPEARTPVAPPAAPAEVEEIINSDDFFRTNFGWDSLDAGKREVEELRKLKTSPAPTFANDTSEKIFNYLKDGKEDEIYDYLDRKRKLSTVDKMAASDAIKLNIQQANPHYKPEDIQDVFEERYTLPEKPISDGDDTEPAYVAQVAKWQQNVDKINRRIERDAFSARQELGKLNTQLVLPDIQKATPGPATPSQEELAKFEASRASYLAALESDGKKFNGFTAEYKDEEVTIPVSFSITPEEQETFKNRIKDFDIVDYIFNKWFPEEKPNVPLIMQDLFLLENKDKVFQKMVNESAKKMMDHRIKIQNNINVSGTGSNQPFQPSGESKDKQEADYLWANA